MYPWYIRHGPAHDKSLELLPSYFSLSLRVPSIEHRQELMKELLRYCLKCRG